MQLLRGTVAKQNLLNTEGGKGKLKESKQDKEQQQEEEEEEEAKDETIHLAGQSSLSSSLSSPYPSRSLLSQFAQSQRNAKNKNELRVSVFASSCLFVFLAFLSAIVRLLSATIALQPKVESERKGCKNLTDDQQEERDISSSSGSNNNQATFEISANYLFNKQAKEEEERENLFNYSTKTNQLEYGSEGCNSNEREKEIGVQLLSERKKLHNEGPIIESSYGDSGNKLEVTAKAKVQNRESKNNFCEFQIANGNEKQYGTIGKIIYVSDNHSTSIGQSNDNEQTSIDRIQMPLQVAPDFEEQVEANELSARIVDEALQSINSNVNMDREKEKEKKEEETVLQEKLIRELEEDEKRIERKITLESSVFDYKDELANAHRLELTRNDSDDVDVDQLILLRSQITAPITMSTSTIQSPESPADTNSLNESLNSQSIEFQLELTTHSEHEKKIGDTTKLEEGENNEEEEEDDDDDDELVDEDNFCGAQQASEVNLRRLKLNTLEDLSVCGQNRHSAEAARQLFNSLCKSQQQRQLNGTLQRGNNSYKNCSHKFVSQLVEDDNDNNNNNNNAEEGSDSGGHYGGASSTASSNLDTKSVMDICAEACDNLSATANDCGYIKLVRRSGSSAGASSTSMSARNYGQTLVCSLSPTSQLMCNNNLLASNATTLADDSKSAPNHINDQDTFYNNSKYNLYPIDGDEIRQCRVAFRENRRLIEQATKLAVANLSICELQQQPSLNQFNTWGPKTASQLQQQQQQAKADKNNNNNIRSRWANSLNRIKPTMQNCTHCQKKLYPVDKLELDFTKTKLNIHRNCFKCQICSTMLRLETYAAINSKLYCPAHIKCVTVSQTSR